MTMRTYTPLQNWAVFVLKKCIRIRFTQTKKGGQQNVDPPFFKPWVSPTPTSEVRLTT